MRLTVFCTALTAIFLATARHDLFGSGEIVELAFEEDRPIVLYN